MGCLGETGFCRIEGCCVLRHALREATLAFLHTLDDYTLADLLAPGARLVGSLGLASEMRGSVELATADEPRRLQAWMMS